MLLPVLEQALIIGHTAISYFSHFEGDGSAPLLVAVAASLLDSCSVAVQGTLLHFSEMS